MQIEYENNKIILSHGVIEITMLSMDVIPRLLLSAIIRNTLLILDYIWKIMGIYALKNHC